jgi:AraC-like DNA-binding protein
MVREWRAAHGEGISPRSGMISRSHTPVLYKRASVTDTDFHYEEIGPPAMLASHVRCMWRLRGPASEAVPAEPIVPDGCVEIVLNLADPFIRHTGAGASHSQSLRLVTGQLSRAVTIAPSGRIDLWGIRFHPWAAAAFLRVHGTELRDCMLALSDASRSLDASLDPVIDAATDQDRRRALITALATHARTIRPVDPVLPALVSFIASQRELLSVRELARRAGLGTRRVQAVFAEGVGMSPKMLMRISRFQRALRIARERSDLSWSAVAMEAGYYDQPHLNHDCQEIAGRAPSALVAKDPGLTEVFLTAGERPSAENGVAG